MRLTYKIIIIFYCFGVSSSFGQNDCDCNDFKQKSELINIRDSTEVFQVSEELKGLNNELCLFKSLELELKLYLNQKKSDKALETIDKLEDVLVKTNCGNELIFSIYLNKAEYYKVVKKDNYNNICLQKIQVCLEKRCILPIHLNTII